MKDLAWGIAATGGIARTVGAVIAAEPGMRVAAVGSRDVTRARELAGALGAESAYGSYAELCADPAVDAVYVATPHASTWRWPRPPSRTARPCCARSRWPRRWPTPSGWCAWPARPGSS